MLDFLLMNADVVMRDLAQQHPIFHNEEDFKLKLVNLLRRSGARADPEVSLLARGSFINIDVVADACEGRIALELKYRQKPTEVIHNGETYKLKNHSALDYHRQDIWRDVERLESVMQNPENRVRMGFVIALSNADGLWTVGRKLDPNDVDFRLDPGRRVDGSKTPVAMRFKPAARISEDRKHPTTIRGSYKVQWRDYSHHGFRYVVLSVGGNGLPQ